MVSVLIAGQEYRQETVADITIMVGRTRVTDAGLPSSCKLTLHTPAVAVVLHDSVTVIDPVYGPRFTGRVTDVEMTHITRYDTAGVPERRAAITLQAVGALAVWGRNRIGDTPWPQETVAERAARIAALVGEPLIVQGGETLAVIPRDVDSKPAIEVITQLANGTGGWLFDTPAGITVLQAVDARRIGNQVMRWDDQTTDWLGMEGSWLDQSDYSPAFPRPIAPGPDIIIYEPKWLYNPALVNQVTVTYGLENANNEQSSIYVDDPDSVTAYGASAIKVTTPLALAADATMRGNLILDRAAAPQWHVTDVTLDLLRIADEDAAPYRDLLPGVRCDLRGLPLPAPSTSFNGVVEGWQETYTANARTFAHRLTLALSDARWSYAVLSWDGIPPRTVWTDIDTAWREISTVDDLAAVGG